MLLHIHSFRAPMEYFCVVWLCYLERLILINWRNLRFLDGVVPKTGPLSYRDRCFPAAKSSSSFQSTKKFHCDLPESQSNSPWDPHPRCFSRRMCVIPSYFWRPQFHDKSAFRRIGRFFCVQPHFQMITGDLSCLPVISPTLHCIMISRRKLPFLSTINPRSFSFGVKDTHSPKNGNWDQEIISHLINKIMTHNVDFRDKLETKLYTIF